MIRITPSLLVGSLALVLTSCINEPSVGANTLGQRKSQFIRRLEQGQPQHVVIFGTSLSQSGAWVGQMRDALDARYPGLVTITNTAEGGQNSEWGRANVDSHVIAHHPDVVFIEFAINDAVARFKLTPGRVRDNLDYMLDRIASALPTCEIVLQIMNPAVGRAKGDPGYRHDLDVYQQIYRDAAKQRGLLLIDHSSTWTGLLRSEGEKGFLHYVPDGVHPSAEAYKRFVTPVVLRVLEGSRGP